MEGREEEVTFFLSLCVGERLRRVSASASVSVSVLFCSVPRPRDWEIRPLDHGSQD